MLVHDRYPMPPYCCYHCRSSKTPVLDLLRDDDDNPNRIEHIYLCAECLMHGARTIAPFVGHKVVSLEQIKEWETFSASLEADLDTARRELVLAIEARDMLAASWASNPPHNTGTSVPAVVLAVDTSTADFSSRHGKSKR